LKGIRKIIFISLISVQFFNFKQVTMINIYHWLLLSFLCCLIVQQNFNAKKAAAPTVVETIATPTENLQLMPPPCSCTLSQGSFSAPLPFMSTNNSAVSFYAYGNPAGSSAGTGLEISQTFLVMMHEDLTTGNTSLIMILDKTNDGSGGDADVVVTCLPDTAFVALADDAGELTGSPPTITGNFNWLNCCTDGGVIGGVGCGNTFTINPTINSGITAFSLVYGTPASPTYINMPDIQCPITINCGGAVCCENAFDISAMTQNPDCTNNNDGSIDLDTDCATTPSFLWSNGQTSQNISNLAPGTYAVTITDANGCSQTESYTLTSNNPDPQPVITGPFEFCEGNTTVLGLDNTYIGYLWSTGSVNPTLTVQTPGSYSVTVTSASGCTGSISVTVAEYPVPTVSDFGEYCQGTTYVYPGNGQNYTEGNYLITFMGGTWQGCDSIVDLIVSEIPEAFTILDEVICQGDYYDVCGISYDATDFYELDCNPGYQGCDSIINLFLLVLDPMVSISPPSVLGCNNSSTFIDATASTGNYFLWTTADGQICDNPQNLYLQVCLPGTYCLTATMEVNNVSCDNTQCVTIVEGGETPDLSITGSDISCNGNNNGSATVVVNNPVGGPFTYLWTPGAYNTAFVDNLFAGTYTVIVTSESSGCSAVESITINEPPLLTSSISAQNNLSCNGGTNGSATITANGGVAPYTYQWCNNQVSTTATGLSAGQCCVTVTDANDCTTVSCASLTEPPLMSLTTNQTNVSCFGGSNGTATANPTGGIPPYSYLWSNGQISQTANNLSAGNIAVTLTDNNGCTTTSTITLTQPAAAMTISGISSNATCGSNNGAINITVTGGSPGYTYLWSGGGGTNEDPQNLGPGNYTVTVNDSNNCTATFSITVNSPGGLSLSTIPSNASCNGLANGSINLTVSAGTGPFTFNWNNGAGSNEDPNNLAAGTYNVTVTDANGCTAVSAATLTEPPVMSLTTNQTNVSCFGVSDGTATVNPTGGIPPYSYLWSNGQMSQTAINLSAGNTSVTLTDNNGCTTSSTIILTQPAAAITISGMSSNATCSSNNGAINITVTGGSPGYTYLWSGGGGTNQDPQNLGPGNYTVTVSDSNNCTETFSIPVNTSSGLSLSTVPSNASCNGLADGSIDLTVSAGTGPFTFNWDNGAGNNEDPDNLTAGTYNVTVTDAAGCTFVASETIGQPLGITANATPIPLSCNGASDGSIILMISGGTNPYAFNWDNAPNVQNPTGLTAGNYGVTITDANNCTSTTAVSITEANAIQLNITPTDATCNAQSNGSISLSVSGGSSPYSYQWTGTASTNQNPTALAAGTYTVTVTDDNGCTQEISTQVNEPAAMSLTYTSVAASCGAANGSINLNVTGGLTPYNYTWSGGVGGGASPFGLAAGNYMVIVADNNSCTASMTIEINELATLTATAVPTDVSCNGSNDGSVDVTVNSGSAPFTFVWDNGDNNEDPVNLPAGPINVLITDANDCTFDLTVVLDEPTAISITGSATAETCGESNGAIDLNVTGGTMPYNYLWTPGNFNVQDPDNLMAGNYTVVVTDANNCTDSYAINVSTPNALSGAISGIDATCTGSSDGSIALLVSGGMPPFNYQWSPIPWNGQNLLDVSAGDYTVIVTDATGCSITLSQSISEPSPIDLSGNATPSLCGQTNGTIDLLVGGGTAPYNYLWSPVGSTAQDLSNIGPGNYTVVVTDTNGCQVNYTIGVPSPNGLSSTAGSTNVSCYNEDDGSIDLTVNGGAAPFTYQWNYNGLITEDLMDIPAGTYSVTITDSDGCSIVDGAIINEPNAILINGNTTGETCNNSNGAITINVNGGTGAYNYLWTPGNSTFQNPSALSNGTYTVLVTDTNGCTSNESFIVDEPNALSGNITPTNASCYNGADGSLSALINGGSAPYSYAWSPIGGTSESAQNLPANNYTLLVTDADGCTLNLTASIEEPIAMAITGTSTQATCGDANGGIDITVTGGTAPYSYLWNPGNISAEDPGNIVAGSYSLTVTDANACTAVYNIGVSTPTMLAANTIPQATTCNGGSDGSVTVSVTGGIAPFDFLWNYNNVTTQTLTNVPAGNYTVTVTDNSGCEVVATAIVSEPSALQITGNSLQAFCGDPIGSIDITVTGGIGPYTYLWSPGGSTLEDPVSLSAGNYTVTVSDNNGCTEIFTSLVDQPNSPTVIVNPTDASCYLGADGAIMVTVSGGLPAFTYEWNNGATSQNIANLAAGVYLVTITDAAGCTFIYSETVSSPDELVASVLSPSNVSCSGGNDGSINLDVLGGIPPYNFNWDNAPDIQNPANLSVGSYNVTVTDANGCMAIADAALTEPLPINVSTSSSPALCNGSANGSANAIVDGGTAPYSYQWSNGSTVQNPPGLTAGSYQVFVTDNNGCTETANIEVSEPEAVVITITDLSQYGNYNIPCAGSTNGSVTVIASGGTESFTYNWSNAASGTVANGLEAGSYIVTATDTNGCTGVEQITLTEPEALFFSAIIEPVSCYGEADGVILIDSISGGTAPYTYSLDGGDFNNFGLFGNLPGGNYELTVQDINGCETTEQLQIFEPVELIVAIVGETEIQLGDSVRLEALINKDTSELLHWEWTQGRYWSNVSEACPDCLKRWVLPLETTLYDFRIVDEDGCIASDQLQLRVRKDRQVYIPNAFSPNDDGNNDYFQIYLGQGVEKVKTFKVFNRWGEVVYELSDFFLMAPTDGWDGRFRGELMNTAVFAYFAEVVFIDGHIEIYKGDLTLMR
jgi:gliding motility-associated-like protein